MAKKAELKKKKPVRDGRRKREARSQKPEWSRRWKFPGIFVCVAIFLNACNGSAEARLRKTLATQATGRIQLPSGRIEISSELRLAPSAHDLEIVGAGTILKASDRFKGRAMLVIEDARAIKLHDFSIDGNRASFEKPVEMAPPENAFRIYYSNNGLLADHVTGLEIENVRFSAVSNFPVIVSRSSGIRIKNVLVEDSGSLNAKGRNNTTGGIVIEEGCTDFDVRESTFRRIRGNSLWTHSLYTSPRSADGIFARNKFETIGRDAIQVGHASRVRVEDNSGSQIGFPAEIVDVENGGTPVGIDTSGNVDHSIYARNRFEEIDGKCLDLDGFHDGSVIENQCMNRVAAASYAFGHFGIVMNNTNPDMKSENVEIRGNVIDGTKFGGLFLMGSGHRVIGNTFAHLNQAGCNESAAQFGCIYKKDEPEMLETGIYLGRGVARQEPVRNNVIRGNTISGHKMKSRCILAGPGVSLHENSVAENTCTDLEPGQ